jgi:hypothetical protein
MPRKPAAKPKTETKKVTWEISVDVFKRVSHEAIDEDKNIPEVAAELLAEALDARERQRKT